MNTTDAKNMDRELALGTLQKMKREKLIRLIIKLTQTVEHKNHQLDVYGTHNEDCQKNQYEKVLCSCGWDLVHKQVEEQLRNRFNPL
jgi:hypothetical protein